MRAKYKPWAIEYLKDHPEVLVNKVDPNSDFFKASKLALEIGSGKGDFIITMADKFPQYNYLAVEVIGSIAGVLAKRIVDEKIKNVLLSPLDVELLFEGIPDRFFDKIYLNFSDPWPKKRHAKRRLTNSRFLKQYYRILKDDGELIFKSDNDALYAYSIEELSNSDFKVISTFDDYKFDEENDAMSEYERKFRNNNQLIHRIKVRKE